MNPAATKSTSGVRNNPASKGVNRLGVVAVAATAAAVVFWGEGFSPVGWIASWQHTHSGSAGKALPIAPAPKTIAGVRAEDNAVRWGTDASASKVPLRLVLVRTTLGANPHAGQAAIGTDAAHPQTFEAGAILESGARIDEIYSDHVVLVKGTQRLLLYVNVNGKATADRSAEKLLEVGGPAPLPRAVHVTQEATTEYVRPVPEYQNDVVVGFRVYPGTQAHIFEQLGLRSGDLLTALNGQPTVDADQVMQQLAGLTDGQSMTATVRRGTQDINVTMDGAVVEQAETQRSARLAARLQPPIPP